MHTVETFKEEKKKKNKKNAWNSAHGVLDFSHPVVAQIAMPFLVRDVYIERARGRNVNSSKKDCKGIP